MCCSLVTVNELDSGVTVVHERFSERGGSILKRLLLEAIASEAARQLTSFSG